MSTANSAKKNMTVDILLLKQWQVVANEKINGLGGYLQQLAGDMQSMGNTMAINLEGIKRALVAKGILSEEEVEESIKLVAEEVEKELKRRAALREQMGPDVPPAEEEIDAADDNTELDQSPEGIDLPEDTDEGDEYPV